MKIDARTLPADEVVSADVCIIGAGPAGITIAREFSNQPFQVCLLDSGGFEQDAETQTLNEGEVIGDPYPPLTETRRRQVGGAAHLWEAQYDYNQYGFRCLPLDDMDFEQHSWLPHSGWPITRANLDPFYERAHPICKIGPYHYDVQNWHSDKAQPLPFKSERLLTKMSQYGPRAPFTHTYREQLQQTDNITLLCYANVVSLETELTDIVTKAKVCCLTGTQFWVKSRVFILATGGIENARLLLLSKNHHPHGLGNQNDLVGRYFMERPILSSGFLQPHHKRLLDQTALYDILNVRGTPVMGWIGMSPTVRAEEQLLNNGAQLYPKPLAVQTQARQALRNLLKQLSKRSVPKNFGQSLQTSLKGLNYISQAGFWSAIRQFPNLRRGQWSYLPYEKRRFSQFEVIYQIEQAPNPNNRVVLGQECDRLGLPKPEVHWKLQEIDLRTIERVQAIWQEEFAAAGLGNLEILSRLGDLKYEKLAIHHHMGTTRMHSNPQQGVVDADCKVHGIRNLYVTGSSVFPTVGYANPTLTIIALALRLADHVKGIVSA